MKQALLIHFSVLFFFTTYAQSKVATDSSYYFNGTDQITRLDSIKNYTYDLACRKSALDIQYAYQDTTGITIKNYRQEQYSYYPNDSLYQILYQYWADTKYTDANRTTYTYTRKGHVATQLHEAWVDSSFWLAQTYIANTYDSAGNISDKVTKIYDYNLGKLVNSTESKFEYNSREQDTVALSLEWNLFTRMWVPTNRLLSDYDNSGFLIKTTQQYWDVFSSVWITQNETDFYNNNLGLADSSVQTSLPDTNEVNKNYFLYDTATSKPAQVTSYQYYADQFIYGRRIKYIHFLSDEVKADTTVNEVSFILDMPDNFIVNSQYALTCFFNVDGTVHERIESFDWSDENIPFHNSDRYSYKTCSSVLPASLLSFTGVQNNNDAILKWQTANEVNTSCFTMQRSTDGIHFTTLNKVPASGNMSGIKNYAYTDANITSLSALQLHYRLMITDKDGIVSYSKAVELDIATGKLAVRLSPNPVSNMLTVYSAVNILNAGITISDLNGRVLYASKQNITAGNTLPIDVSKYAKGLYIITIQSATEKYKFKIVK